MSLYHDLAERNILLAGRVKASLGIADRASPILPGVLPVSLAVALNASFIFRQSGISALFLPRFLYPVGKSATSTNVPLLAGTYVTYQNGIAHECRLLYPASVRVSGKDNLHESSGTCDVDANVQSPTWEGLSPVCGVFGTATLTSRTGSPTLPRNSVACSQLSEILVCSCRTKTELRL